MRRLLLLVLVALTMKANGQDPHFSQFFASPLTLNPAFTGKIDGDFRLAGNYRNQWPTINRAYTTTTFSADFPIMRNHIASNDTWGFGVMGYSDQSANSAVKFNYGTVSTAFHKGLDEDGYQQLGAAFQATYSNMMIDISNLKFEDQLTSNGWTGSTTETFNNTTLKNSYIDLNAGILYTASTTDRNNFYAGISMYHINRPKENFTNKLFLLNPRTTFHAGGYFPIGQTSILHVSGQHSRQANNAESVLGGAIQLPIGGDGEKPSSLYVGSWLRLKDAVIPYIGLEFGDLRFGATYDITVSSLSTASNRRGGMEVSLIYIRRSPESRGLPCPKF